MLVQEGEEPTYLTGNLPKKFSQISYTLDDDEEEKQDDDKDKVKKNAVYHLQNSGAET